MFNVIWKIAVALPRSNDIRFSSKKSISLAEAVFGQSWVSNCLCQSGKAWSKPMRHFAGPKVPFYVYDIFFIGFLLPIYTHSKFQQQQTQGFSFEVNDFFTVSLFFTKWFLLFFSFFQKSWNKWFFWKIRKKPENIPQSFEKKTIGTQESLFPVFWCECFFVILVSPEPQKVFFGTTLCKKTPLFDPNTLKRQKKAISSLFRECCILILNTFTCFKFMHWRRMFQKLYHRFRSSCLKSDSPRLSKCDFNFGLPRLKYSYFFPIFRLHIFHWNLFSQPPAWEAPFV